MLNALDWPNWHKKWVYVKECFVSNTPDEYGDSLLYWLFFRQNRMLKYWMKFWKFEKTGDVSWAESLLNISLVTIEEPSPCSLSLSWNLSIWTVWFLRAATMYSSFLLIAVPFTKSEYSLKTNSSFFVSRFNIFIVQSDDVLTIYLSSLIKITE